MHSGPLTNRSTVALPGRSSVAGAGGWGRRSGPIVVAATISATRSAAVGARSTSVRQFRSERLVVDFDQDTSVPNATLHREFLTASNGTKPTVFRPCSGPERQHRGVVGDAQVARAARAGVDRCGAVPARVR